MKKNFHRYYHDIYLMMTKIREQNTNLSDSQKRGEEKVQTYDGSWLLNSGIMGPMKFKNLSNRQLFIFNSKR